MTIAVVSNGLNIAGNAVLIWGFHLGVAGAAIATAFAQTVSVLFAVVILLKKELPFSIAREDVRINPQYGKFLGMGLPLALQEFLTQLSRFWRCVRLSTGWA